MHFQTNIFPGGPMEAAIIGGKVFTATPSADHRNTQTPEMAALQRYLSLRSKGATLAFPRENKHTLSIHEPFQAFLPCEPRQL